MSMINHCFDFHESNREKINEIFAFFGINHTGWEILKSVNDKAGIVRKELFALLSQHAESSIINKLLIKFRIAGIVYDVEEKLVLTTNGADLFKSCYARQQQMLQQAPIEAAVLTI